MPFPGDTEGTDPNSHSLDMLPTTSPVHRVVDPRAMAGRPHCPLHPWWPKTACSWAVLGLRCPATCAWLCLPTASWVLTGDGWAQRWRPPWHPFRGELWRRELAPLSSCFPEVMMLFWGGDGGQAWVTPCPPLCPPILPAMPSCSMQKGTGGVVCVNTPDMGLSPHPPFSCRGAFTHPIPSAHGGVCAGSCWAATEMSLYRPALPSHSRACNPGMEARPCCVRGCPGRSEGHASGCPAQHRCLPRSYGLTLSLAPQALTDSHSEDTREVPSSCLTRGSLAWPWGRGRRLGPWRLSTGRACLPAPVLGLVLSPGPDPASLGEAGSGEKGVGGCLPPASTR